MPNPDLGIVPHRQLRTLADGRYLFGGSPRRMLRLTDAGRRRVALWFSGRAHPVSEHERGFAGRLITAGMAHPRRPDATSDRAVDVVIPVFDDPDGLVVTLRSLVVGRSSSPSTLRITVVDDGSRIPVHVPDRIGTFPVSVIHHRTNRGPAAARNTGLDAGRSPLVLFVDAGVRLDTETIEALAAWMEDDRVVAVAPRVVSTLDTTWVGRYERDHSPLDIGLQAGEPCVIGPDRSARYVPSTVLLVERSALGHGHRFDEDLRFGEDVDLVWRLGRSGWVVFDPELVARHDPRSTVTGLARQRFAYGSSAGPLALRHGSVLSPLVFGAPLALACAAQAVLPLRWSATATAGLLAVDARRSGRLFDSATAGSPGAFALGTLETARAWTASTGALVRFAGRVGWPMTAVLIGQPFSGAVRRRAVLLLLTRLLMAWRDAGMTAAPLSLIDDLAYGTGVWAGAIASRQPAAVVPSLVRRR